MAQLTGTCWNPPTAAAPGPYLPGQFGCSGTLSRGGTGISLGWSLGLDPAGPPVG